MLALHLLEVAPQVRSRHTSALFQAHLRRQGADLLSLQSWFCCVSVSLYLQLHVETRGHPQVLFLGCHIPLFERRSLPPRCEQHGETAGKANHTSTSAVQMRQLLHHCAFLHGLHRFVSPWPLPLPFFFIFKEQLLETFLIS